MRFLRALFGRKGGSSPARRSGNTESLEQSYRDTIGSIVDENSDLQRGGEQGVNEILTNINTKVNTGEAPGETAHANIWDMENARSSELPSEAPTLPTPAPSAAASAAARSPARSRRTKTRLIGFDKSDGDVVDIFNDAPSGSAPVAAPVRAKFPVGWIVVSDGPGRGESFPLFTGMSQIGRGDDQNVKLDFGDNSISRTNHAAIVFDTETKEFLLGHGGKSNIVRLNDKPLISNEPLKTGDVIRIGETALRFVALCDETFSWDDKSEDGEEDEDVAIA